MDEWSRIQIEQYCLAHNSEKSRRLSRLVEMSYDLSAEISDPDAIWLQRIIAREKDPDLKEALQDLDDFMCNW